MNRCKISPLNIITNSRNISTTTICYEIQKMTRLRVVDNSQIGKQAMAEGKPPKCIHVYNKTGVGKIGSHFYIQYWINE